MSLRRFESLEEAATVLAAQVAAALRLALQDRQHANLAVPGGRTPVALFRALRVAALDWEHVRVTLTDERWVPETDPASNAALVRRELLQEEAARSTFLPLYSSAANAGAGAQQASRVVADCVPFDVVVLGMGADGHFASLFPGSPGIAAALDPLAVPAALAMRAPAAPMDRLSLNLAALAATPQLYLLVTGADKLEVLKRAQQEAQGRDPAAFPITALLALRQPTLDVFWAP